MNTIVDYSILWLIGIENHYMMTKDYEFLRIVYPKMQSLMRYLMEQTKYLVKNLLPKIKTNCLSSFDEMR
ncbi:hypothetical protein EfmAA290_13500 [Enterococcus faecium]|nr:hypothetical protein EfmAA290_13500 [Enterococcus faecium]